MQNASSPAQALEEVLKHNHEHTKNGPKAVEYDRSENEFPKMYYDARKLSADDEDKRKPSRIVLSQKAADALGKDWSDKPPALQGGLSPEELADAQAKKAAEEDEE
jgi:hypothetical protein